MLFDSCQGLSGFSESLTGGAACRFDSPAGHRAADGFLTLPAISQCVPAIARLRHTDEGDLTGLIRAHFEAGPLSPRDARSSGNAGDMFAEAMFAWLRRRTPTCKRLLFGFALLDQAAARDQVDQFGWETDLSAPLYLAIELPHEQIFEIGARIHPLQRAHPGLLCSVMALINEASCNSLFLRTPSYFLEMFARWWWDWDEGVSDENARESLADRLGADSEDIERYLPSNVRPVLAPEEMFPERGKRKGRKGPRRSVLKRSEVLELARSSSRWIQRVCRAMLQLEDALQRAKGSKLFEHSQWAEPAYSAASIAVFSEEWIGELLDDHFECISNSGEATMYQVLIPLASDPQQVPKQYEDLSRMFEIVKALDQLLTIISR